MKRRRFPSVLPLVLAAVASCSDAGGPPTMVNFTLPGAAAADFFDQPFPCELRRNADGTVDLAGFPGDNPLVAGYLEEIARDFRGFGTQSGVFFRLSGPLDPATLPDPNATTQSGAAVFLVNVTPDSPDFGARAPLRIAFKEDAGKFIGPNALVLLPYPGFPLRPDTTYAAVVTTAVRDARGRSIAAAPDLAALLEERGDAAALAAFRPLLDWLDAGEGGVGRDDVAGATVFRTQDPTSMMGRLRAAVHVLAEPAASDVVHTGSDSHVEIFEGTYEGPNFQQGEPPYKATGGAFEVDASGAPVVARMETLRFAVTVPTGPMPPDGWPIVLYAHGTGGDYQSFIRSGVGEILGHVTDDAGTLIAAMATFGIDQVLHGPRDPTGGNPELTFFNFQNLPAARDNARQGALDDFQLLRMARALTITMPDGSVARFDGSRVAFMGHSQGGITGPPFLGYEPDVGAAVLSGAGGNLILSLLGKTEPVDIPGLVAGLLQEDVDEFHPVLSLLQMYLEPADPENYARLFFREPPSAQPPKNIYQSLGVVDHLTPVPTIMALAVGMGVTPVAPLILPVDGLDLAGRTAADPPIEGNVADGAATGVLCEYDAGAGEGHYVVFDVPAAQQDYARFLATFMRDGRARHAP